MAKNKITWDTALEEAWGRLSPWERKQIERRSVVPLPDVRAQGTIPPPANPKPLPVEPVKLTVQRLPGLQFAKAERAAQTSFLYVIQKGPMEVKVGFSCNVEKRRSQLQSANSRTLSIYTKEPVDCLYPQEAEARAHQLLERHRIRGEWFRCHPEVALAAVRRAAWEAEDGC